ncbi:MAG: hypothetical protein IKG11_01635 [Atopobiaceae bacterium]|nr:hypothetical protein [Atopobiaceae bacterium]
MALYWPEKKVALDIIDDPCRRPFTGGDDWTVLQVTCDELEDYKSYRHVMAQLAALLDKQVPDDGEWERNRELRSRLMSQVA